jgi:hypothetical protein
MSIQLRKSRQVYCKARAVTLASLLLHPVRSLCLHRIEFSVHTARKIAEAATSAGAPSLR